MIPSGQRKIMNLYGPHPPMRLVLSLLRTLVVYFAKWYKSNPIQRTSKEADVNNISCVIQTLKSCILLGSMGLPHDGTNGTLPPELVKWLQERVIGKR